MAYQVPQKILDKYADVLINFALNSGQGIKNGEVVFLQVDEAAKPLLVSLRRAALKAGANPIIQYFPTDITREYFELANNKQLNFFPAKYYKGILDTADHQVGIISETDKHELEGIDPKKIMTKNKTVMPYKQWRDKKEAEGKFTWTLALYGTEAMAKEAKMSLKDYWQQIIQACFLDYPDPVKKWREVFRELNRVQNKLNELKIEKVHVEAKGTDLWLKLGSKRRFLGGMGRNIPSFELFISPDWRGTQGYISFNQPLYRYGNIVKGIRLEFKNGKVVKATARRGEKVIKEMIKVEDADKVGEFSLTDGRLSRISKFMGETLFDENMGGKYGNTHLALGSAYKDSYPEDAGKVSKKKWQDMGYNDSAVHTDMISTKNRLVTAILKDGKELLIYKDGKFII